MDSILASITLLIVQCRHAIKSTPYPVILHLLLCEFHTLTRVPKLLTPQLICTRYSVATNQRKMQLACFHSVLEHTHAASLLEAA